MKNAVWNSKYFQDKDNEKGRKSRNMGIISAMAKIKNNRFGENRQVYIKD